MTETRSPYPPFHPERLEMPLVLSSEQFQEEFPGEGQYLEFKKGLGSKTIQETAVAFSNAEGGVILLGVEDDGTIEGRKLDAGTSDSIHETFKSIHNPGRYFLHELAVGEKSVVVIGIAKRREGFAQQSNGIVRVRKGTRDEPLFGTELQELANQRSVNRYEVSETRVNIEDADTELVENFRQAFGWAEDTVSDRLRESGYAVGNHLTVAGVLFLTREPRSELGKTFVEVLRYRDDESVDYDLRREYAGPVPDQLVDATDAVVELLGTEMVVLGVRRYELPQIPPVVLREATANALAHRSYELNRTAVRIEIRPTSVRILSPGGLPEPVTLENIRETTAPRNIAVIKALRRFGLAEDAGRGIDVMEDTMLEQMLDPPVIEDQDHAVAVGLPLGSVVAPDERAWIVDLERQGKLSGLDRLLLVHAARGETLTNSKVRELFQLDRAHARETLQHLRDEGFLRQEGERGGATYSLKRSLSPPAGLRLTPSQLLEFVETMAEKRPISNADVRAATGLERNEVRSILAKLVAEGRLVQTGSRKGTRYHVP